MTRKDPICNSTLLRPSSPEFIPSDCESDCEPPELSFSDSKDEDEIPGLEDENGIVYSSDRNIDEATARAIVECQYADIEHDFERQTMLAIEKSEQEQTLEAERCAVELAEIQHAVLCSKTDACEGYDDYGLPKPGSDVPSD